MREQSAFEQGVLEVRGVLPQKLTQFVKSDQIFFIVEEFKKFVDRRQVGVHRERFDIAVAFRQAWIGEVGRPDRQAALDQLFAGISSQAVTFCVKEPSSLDRIYRKRFLIVYRQTFQFRMTDGYRGSPVEIKIDLFDLYLLHNGVDEFPDGLQAAIAGRHREII